MTAPTAWPDYDVGPHDAVFAIGVASINYARLEFAFSGLFAKVLGITNSQAWEILASTRSNYQRLQRMKDALQKLWPLPGERPSV
jgi:hypothetical protein